MAAKEMRRRTLSAAKEMTRNEEWSRTCTGQVGSKGDDTE